MPATDLFSPERLPPPPFWRTRYFAFDVLPRRPYLDPLDIVRILVKPDRKVVQKDGRLRLYGYAAGIDRYLRVVLLPDRETVHNAFIDEDFRP